MTKQDKYIIAFDTLCEGYRCAIDQEGNPHLYNSYDEAFKELFSDAICGIEGNPDHLEDEDARENMITEMNDIFKSGDIEKMQEYFNRCPDANYYGEFIEKAEEFILGRKAIFDGQGITITGTKLNN